MSQAICKLQSTGITIDGAEGRVKPCCHFDSNKTFNIPDVSDIENFEQVLDSKLSKRIKKLTKKGILFQKETEIIPQCDTCWDRERNKLQSRRTWYNKKLTGTGATVENLQIALDYTCNLMCRICAPKHSSKWNSAKDVIKKLRTIYPEHPVYEANPIKQNYSENIKRVIQNSDLTNLKTIELIGGEPFYSKHFNWFIETICEKCNPENIEFSTVTNGTIVPPKDILDKLLRFKCVNIKLSIDGLGPLAESTRHGVDWNTIDKNIHTWAKLHNKANTGQIEVRANPTVSILNVNKLQEIIDYFDDWKDITVAPHGLQGPSWLCLEQIPIKIRKKWVPTYRHPYQNHQFKNIVLNDRVVENKLKRFLESTLVLDNHYGMAFKDCNPEMYEIIKRLVNVEQ
tara:strand:+ start:9444 stop:10640 length:1197 start_codon:yes stop_codon:yes gene_type:complete